MAEDGTLSEREEHERWAAHVSPAMVDEVCERASACAIRSLRGNRLLRLCRRRLQPPDERRAAIFFNMAGCVRYDRPATWHY